MLTFGERMEQTEQSEWAQSKCPSSSNRYQSNSDNLSDGPLLSDGHNTYTNSRASRITKVTNGEDSVLNDPPNPPNLGLQHSGKTFGLQRADVKHREVIKLFIEFPLRNSSSGNDIALIFLTIYNSIICS